MHAQSALASALLAALALGCGEKDEPEPPPSVPRDPIAVVEGAAQRLLDAGPSELRITVVPQAAGGGRYEIRETLDPGSWWYLTEPPRARRGVRLASRSPITGPAFSFGYGNSGRAYVGPIGEGDDTCWIEAHAPAGAVRGGLSAEEALVTAHTVLALLTRNVRAVTEPTLDLGALAPFFADKPRTYALRLAPPDTHDTVALALAPNVDATNRYINELRRSGRRVVRGIAGRILVGVKHGLPSVVVINLRGGQSALDFTPRRPAASVIVTFDGIGEGEPVREPGCLGIE